MCEYGNSRVERTFEKSFQNLLKLENSFSGALLCVRRPFGPSFSLEGFSIRPPQKDLAPPRVANCRIVFKDTRPGIPGVAFTPTLHMSATDPEIRAVLAGRVTAASGEDATFWQISAKCCSFSAVSAPSFARKYALCSIFQNLPDSQADMFEIL